MKFDEFTIGQTFETKSFKLTKENIMEFAEEFDPQYMHFDEEKAKQGRFNGIIASGVHTLGISFKHWIKLVIYGDDIIAGREMHNIVNVIDKRAVKKDAGIITVSLSTYNDKDEKVFKGDLLALIKQ